MRYVLIIALIGFAGFFGYHFFTQKPDVQEVDSSHVVQEKTFVEHVEPELNISFSYRTSPDGYTLQDIPASIEEDPTLQKVFILTRTKEYEELLASDIPREGPPTMNILIYKDTSSPILESWLTQKEEEFHVHDDEEEEFHVHDDEEEEDTHFDTYNVGGLDGLSYEWEGLYDGQTIAIKNGELFYLFVGTTYSGFDDDRGSDFAELLASVVFSN